MGQGHTGHSRAPARMESCPPKPSLSAALSTAALGSVEGFTPQRSPPALEISCCCSGGGGQRADGVSGRCPIMNSP